MEGQADITLEFDITESVAGRGNVEAVLTMAMIGFEDYDHPYPVPQDGISQPKQVLPNDSDVTFTVTGLDGLWGEAVFDRHLAYEAAEIR